jgi:hypothetical protein
MESPVFWEQQKSSSKKEADHEVKVGCCGFAGAQSEYFRLFRVIEVLLRLPVLGRGTGKACGVGRRKTCLCHVQQFEHERGCAEVHASALPENTEGLREVCFIGSVETFLFVGLSPTNKSCCL